MSQIEKIPEVNIPNLESIERNVSDTIQQNTEIITDGVPQCEAFCERNPVAMEEFFKKFLSVEQI